MVIYAGTYAFSIYKQYALVWNTRMRDLPLKSFEFLSIHARGGGLRDFKLIGN